MFRKYYEMGYSVIPVYAKSKSPAIEGWQKFCINLPADKDIDEWEINHNGNIGVACGPASGITVVDIDTDDKEILNLFPDSPVKRRGKKGEARFFKYNPNIKTGKMLGIVDILNIGRQVLLPPSIHPETDQPYTWCGIDSLLHVKSNELPDLDLSSINSVKVNFIAPQQGGRNDKLKSIVTSMRARSEDEIKIVTEVYEYDLHKHEPRLFTDNKEGFKALSENHAFNNAWLFVNNITKSLINNGVVSLIKVEINVDENKIELFKPKNFPEPTGTLKDIQDLIIKTSNRYMPNLALGGAVSIIAACISNRFRFDKTWPNIYILNLAPTGAGKSFPQDVVKLLLAQEIDTKLMGFGDYRSSAAFVKGLLTKRERLDVVDEASSLFFQMKDGGLYQSEIMQYMCKLWSDSKGLFLNAEYSEKEDTSSCYNPCISFLGSTTIEGFKNSVNRSMYTSGLIPRFLIMAHESYGKRKKMTEDTELLNKVKKQINLILSVDKKENPFIKDVLRGPSYLPTNITCESNEAKALYESISFELDSLIETETNEPLKECLTRGMEQIKKLSLIYACSNGLSEIDTSCLRWGKSFFETSLFNSKSFIEESAADGDWDKDMQRVLNLFNKETFLTEARIKNRMRIHLSKLNLIIKHLLDANLIKPAKSGKKNVSGFVIHTDNSSKD